MTQGYTPPGPLTSPQAAQVERDKMQQRTRQLEEGHVVIEAPKGLYIRSANGHFWQLTATDAGALALVDAGTVRP